MIRGRCHTADNTLSLEFDATPWFKEADAESILNLAQQGWSGTGSPIPLKIVQATSVSTS